MDKTVKCQGLAVTEMAIEIKFATLYKQLEKARIINYFKIKPWFQK